MSSDQLPAALKPIFSADFELQLHRRLFALHAQFKDGADPTKVPRAALRSGMDLLGASKGCVAVLPRDSDRAEISFCVPRNFAWDEQFLGAFVRGKRSQVPGNMALGRLRRHDRMVGTLAVVSDGGQISWAQREALSSIADAANEIVARMDEARIREVRARLDFKLMEQLRPKDVFYQILHGLQSLTDYDHSASVLICNEDAQVLELAAEQIAWRKAKSPNIGLRLPLTEELLNLLQENVVYGFDRDGDGWKAWGPGRGLALAQFMDYHCSDSASPGEAAILCAPLVSRNTLLGVLRIASARRGAFSPYEAKLVDRFLPVVSVALQISRRTESLEREIILAHRKHAMADLARSVAHDVNNALGAILPLVQQIRAEVKTGKFDAAALADDLGHIETSAQVCRRIFGGMLSFARGAARHSGQAVIRQSVEFARAIVSDGLARRKVSIVVDLSHDVTAVHGVQAELDQLLLNLFTNSRDALLNGGQLAVRARQQGGHIEIIVEDTGCGIAPEHMSKVQEPFFSTKPDGNGLGLAICRSIVWQMGGTLNIHSALGEGTRVTALLPAYQSGV